MQECRVCGLLFLGGGACPSCGSQVAVDVNTDDIVMDDESIPGLEDIADAIGDTEDEDTSNADLLPFGMGAKAEVIQSSLPFGVGSFSDSVTEVAIPIGEQDYEEDPVVEEPVSTEQNRKSSLKSKKNKLLQSLPQKISLCQMMNRKSFNIKA